MIDFGDSNKKHVSQAWDIIFCILVLLAAGTAGYCFGYDSGAKAIKAQAIDNGHAVYKDGVFRWEAMINVKKGI